MFEIILDAPGKNALSIDLLTKLEAQLDEAKGAPLFLTGAGEVFCAGLNLKEVASFDAAGLDAFLERFDRVVARLFDYPAPTLAFANGHAIAGGCVLTLCCDLRFGVDNPKSRLGLNETALGVIFPPFTERVVSHRLGAHAPAVMLGAGLHTPAKAHRLGILTQLGSEAEARAALETLAAYPEEAYAGTKAHLQAGVTALSSEQAAKERASAMEMWTGDSFRARLNAALGR